MNISQEKGIKNLLVIGHTNVGKSTLCNVICDTNEFDENDYTAKESRSFQKKTFKWNENEYRVVEVGVGSIEKKDLYNKIGEVIYLMPGGISQILFVIDGRFTSEEIRAFKSFEKEILNSGVVEYTTIVRTKFVNFKIKEKCDEDKIQMCYESESIAKIVKLCKDIIYVNNPPINIHIEDDDDRERIENNKKKRARSRIKLLDHLETVCQKKYYKLKTWDELHNKIASYIESNGAENIAEEVERNLKLGESALIIDDQVTQEIKS
jgi:GTPase SAR1 family protein